MSVFPNIYTFFWELVFRTLEAGIESLSLLARVLGKSEKGCWEFGMGREWGGVEKRGG
jgi:hypothetical protein